MEFVNLNRFRILYVLLILVSMACVSGIVAAQEGTQTPSMITPEPTATPVEGFNDPVVRAEQAAERAEAALDRSFDILNLFEIFGAVFTLLIPAVALAAGFFGFRRLQQLDQQLGDAVSRFAEIERIANRMMDTRLEVEELSARVTRDIARSEEKTQALEQKQANLDALREELANRVSNATLALSYVPLGERQYRFRDFAGALEIYQRAQRLDSDNPIIHLRLGYVYTQSGKLQEAEHHLKKALNIEPDLAPALAALGYVYRRIGEKMPVGVERDAILNESERKLLRALTIAPRLVDDDGESWWGSLGGLYRRRNQVDEAIRAYTKAAEVMPYSSYAFSNLALLYMQKNDRKRMIETYHKVEELAFGEVQADPDNYWACADLLTARLALNKLNEAEEALKFVFRTAPIESPYALQALIDTLGRLATVLEPEQARNVRNYIDRIRTFSEEQQAAFRASQAAQSQATDTAETVVTGD